MRTLLDPRIEKLKPMAEKLFAELQTQCQPHWYASCWAEIRSNNRFQYNQRSESLTDSETQGLVWRIFDGKTLFESASEDWTEAQLRKSLSTLVLKVKSLSKTSSADSYKVPTWKERLAEKLDPEITEQIPEGVVSEQWVHFGSRLKEPLFASQKETMNWLSAKFKQLQKESEVIAPDFTQASLVLQEDHFLFLDREVRLTQSLNRNLSQLILMKGEDRSRVVKGGVGGKESLEITGAHFKECVERLEHMQKAERLEPGRYLVLMGPVITGVFAHEAFGHTQEGDTWARGRSKAKELYEKQTKVGNEHATILNNPAIYENGDDGFAAWGSYFFDEEGWFASETTLVEKGLLKPPMTNLSSHHSLKVPRTANGKREDWSHGVYTRQTNTYFSAGDKTLDEMIASMDYGFIAEECAGGMEDPKGMGIQVGIQYLEEVKDGKKTGRTFKGPNGGALQMTGYVPDYLSQIECKSFIDPTGKKKDLKHPWNDVGGCGKYHKEFVNAGCGGPYMLVRDVLLG